mgnify:CR=1 FL=1
MRSIEGIYQLKLTVFYDAAKEGAARFGTDSNVFSDLLSAIEGRLDTQSAAPQTDTSNAGAIPEIETAIDMASRRFGLDESLIRAVIQAESDFDPHAVSCCGAQGLMQLMPGTARSLGVVDPFNVQQNVLGGTQYLKKQLEGFGDIRLALAAYNAGPGKIGSLHITDPDDPEQYLRISDGVRSYVDRVLNYRDRFIYD